MQLSASGCCEVTPAAPCAPTLPDTCAALPVWVQTNVGRQLKEMLQIPDQAKIGALLSVACLRAWQCMPGAQPLSASLQALASLPSSRPASRLIASPLPHNSLPCRLHGA